MIKKNRYILCLIGNCDTYIHLTFIDIRPHQAYINEYSHTCEYLALCDTSLCDKQGSSGPARKIKLKSVLESAEDNLYSKVDNLHTTDDGESSKESHGSSNS